MAEAARVFEATNHPGIIVKGAKKTRINSLRAARMGDKHVCLLPPTAGPHPSSTIATGSATVKIEGQPAARRLDTVGCGATITTGSPNVNIGG